MSRDIKKVPSKVTIRPAELVLIVWVDPHEPGDDNGPWSDVPNTDEPIDRAICFDIGWIVKEDAKSIDLAASLQTWHSKPYEVDGIGRRGVVPKNAILTIPKKDMLCRHVIKVPKRMLAYD